MADRLDLARLSIHRDIVVERRQPTVAMAGAPLHLPPRSFLQATEEAEERLRPLGTPAATSETNSPPETAVPATESAPSPPNAAVGPTAGPTTGAIDLPKLQIVRDVPKSPG